MSLPPPIFLVFVNLEALCLEVFYVLFAGFGITVVANTVAACKLRNTLSQSNQMRRNSWWLICQVK